jgi:FkbM family methyltransferase
MSREKGMNLKSSVKKLVEQMTGTQILRSIPHGIDPARDIAKSLLKYRAEVVFDVGANIGQSSKDYLNKFPNAHIYCFEPVSDTFRQLQNNLEGNERVDCFQLAFGSAKGSGEMVLQGESDMFFLLDSSKESLTNSSVLTESVNIVTVDEFCQKKGIDCISYLKIDTEGGDLEVLKGAVQMLAEQRIDCVQVEAGMNPNNSRHAPIEFLKEFLESYKYFLFGIYEQTSEDWFNGRPHLRRTNLLFISYNVIEANRSRN